MPSESVLVTLANKFKVAEWINEYDGYEAIPAIGQPFIQIKFNDRAQGTAHVGMYILVVEFGGMYVVTAKTAGHWKNDVGLVDKLS